MLVNLHMKNIALVKEGDVSFSEGLNVLTGETGAGKSVLIGGISAAIGAASLKEYCPENASYSLVELTFEPEGEAMEALLAKRGITMEDGQVILSRKYQKGRTINRINGETVPASALKEAASLLIDIHGQNQHHSLLRPSAHRQVLDRFCAKQLGELPQQCAASHHAWQEAEALRKEATMDETQRIKQMDLLRYEIDEIANAALAPGEDEKLEEQFRKMSNGQKILDAVSETAYFTGGENGASALLSRAVRSLLPVSAYDPAVSDLFEELTQLESLASDFDRDISVYLSDFTYDEETFKAAQERLDSINRLKLKYGTTIEEILEGAKEREEKLKQLEHYEQYLASLEKKAKREKEKLTVFAERISRIRREYAPVLEEKITKALQDLNFLDTRFSIDIVPLAQVSANGMDEVTFCISLNPGMPSRPLQDVASGGELSRIMLALKSVMAEQDEIETLIFDEIDTGISGRTAQKVSEKMAVIAKHHQVICITHLAQIAAMADRHFVIEKHLHEGETQTTVRTLPEEGMTQELARILGGARITETVLRSAAEMKEQADRIKQGIIV